MLHQILFRPVVTVAFILLACPILIPTFGQGREQVKPKAEAEKVVPAFKGNGIARPSRTRQLVTSTPPALGAGVLAKLIGREPGSLYARLTPSLPEVANRGALVFVHASLVEGGEGYAEWFRPSLAEHEAALKEDYLELWLKSFASGKYLIDCVVSGQFVNFLVIGLTSGGTQTSTLAETKGHLIFTLEATSAGWYGFRISGSGYNWAFYSCEVTNL